VIRLHVLSSERGNARNEALGTHRPLCVSDAIRFELILYLAHRCAVTAEQRMYRKSLCKCLAIARAEVLRDAESEQALR